MQFRSAIFRPCLKDFQCPFAKFIFKGMASKCPAATEMPAEIAAITKKIPVNVASLPIPNEKCKIKD